MYIASELRLTITLLHVVALQPEKRAKSLRGLKRALREEVGEVVEYEQVCPVLCSRAVISAEAMCQQARLLLCSNSGRQAI